MLENLVVKVVINYKLVKAGHITVDDHTLVEHIQTAVEFDHASGIVGKLIVKQIMELANQNFMDVGCTMDFIV